MPANIKSWMIRFDALSPREKVMSTAAVAVVIWALWDNVVEQPLLARHRQLKTDISGLESRIFAQEQAMEQLQSRNRGDTQQQQLKRLQQSVDQLKQQLHSGDKKFVPPLLMAEALRDILQDDKALKLIKLQNLPVAPFETPVDQPAWVYRHSLAITLQGDFFSTLNYLKALENLPWRLHWDSIDYTVEQHPNAKTRIELYTLSFDKEWLGV